MIETVVLNHLAANLGVPVYMEIPAKPADTFVVLQKTGGGRVNYVRSAMVAVQSYAPTMLAAAQLNERVKAAMDLLPVLPEIGSSRLNSDYGYTDTASKRQRYQAVYDITHY